MDNDEKQFEIFKKNKGLKELITHLEKSLKTMDEANEEEDVQKKIILVKKSSLLLDEMDNIYEKIWPKKEKENG